VHPRKLDRIARLCVSAAVVGCAPASSPARSAVDDTARDALRAGLYQAAARVVADTPNNPRILVPLAELARVLPETSDLESLAARYGDDVWTEVDSEVKRSARDAVEYLRGRGAYRAARYDEAERHLSRVALGSPFHAKAQLVLFGVHVRRRHGASAHAALAWVRIAREPGLHDVATIDVARLAYSRALRVDPDGTPLVDAAAMANAVGRWDEVAPTSALGKRAKVEQAWGYWVMGDHARVARQLEPFVGPASDDVVFAEAMLLAALDRFAAEEFAAAEALLARLDARYVPVRAKIDRVRVELEAMPPAARHPHVTAIPPTSDVRRALAEVWTSGSVQQLVAYLALLDDEEKRFAAMPEGVRGSRLGVVEQSAILAARTRVSSRLGESIVRAIVEKLGEIDATFQDADNLRKDLAYVRAHVPRAR
jgi:hypothetical protein